MAILLLERQPQAELHLPRRIALAQNDFAKCR
jgi:hypothetical protein